MLVITSSMLTIEDIMDRGEIFAVAETTPLAEVAWELAVRNLDGAPVTDETGRLVGTIARGDLVDPRLAKSAHGAGRRRLTVADVMSDDVPVARGADPAREAVRLLAQPGSRGLLLVADEDDRLVGMVATDDVLAALARGERFDAAEVGAAAVAYGGDCRA